MMTSVKWKKWFSTEMKKTQINSASLTEEDNSSNGGERTQPFVGSSLPLPTAHYSSKRSSVVVEAAA